jgi:hypothetical protein
MLEAMRLHGGGKLVGMDPAQHDLTWCGGGLHNVLRAGFADRYVFHEEPSQVMLPQGVQLIAVRKQDEDRRSFDHFMPF